MFKSNSTAVKARQAKGQTVEIVDNYALSNRAYGIGPEFTCGTQEQQSGDWVHPRAESAAWKGMAMNFNEGLKRVTATASLRVVGVRSNSTVLQLVKR